MIALELVWLQQLSRWIVSIIIILAISNCVPAFKKVVCPHFFFFRFWVKHSMAVNYSTSPFFVIIANRLQMNPLRPPQVFIRKVIVWNETKLLIQVFFLPFLIETSCHCFFFAMEYEHWAVGSALCYHI